MPTTAHALLACLALAGSAKARVPGKVELERYEHLWENSPICWKKPVESPRSEPFLSEWLLAGISEIEGGYLVTLSHRHHAGESLVIRPTGTDHFRSGRVEAAGPGVFQIERVELAKDWRDIEVHLIAKGERVALRFEEKAVLPGAAPVAPDQALRPAAKRIQPGLTIPRRK
jgi:hypothetical protein